MADDQDVELEIEEGGGSKMKLIIIAAVVVLAIAGGAAFFFMGGDDGPAAEGEDVAEVKQKAVYVDLPGSITANISDGKRTRTVQVKLSLLVRSSEAENAVKNHVPRIKNDVLLLLSGQQADQITTPEGRRTFQDAALATIQKTLEEMEGQQHVEQLLITSFVMQ